MDSLKRALKSLFKRGKKNKQDVAAPQETQSSSDPPAAPTTTSAAPPQLPPVQNASPLQSPSPEDASKPLPPTHPLATGPHSEPQVAVPQKQDVEPHATSDAAVAPVNTANLAKDHNEETNWSPAIPADEVKDATPPPQTASHPLEGTNVGMASAADNIETPAPPTKTDSAIVAPDQPDVAKENSLPSANGATAVTEDKVAVIQDEPPPIKAIKAAPGMSATSGPLEDFPEGGDLHDDESHS